VENGNSQRIGRRRTLTLLGLSAIGGALAVACKKDEGGAASSSGAGGNKPAGGGCATPPDEASKTMRKTLQYKAATDNPAKKCSGCAQYTAGTYGDCGGCKLFSGPVQPNGVCLSYAPLGAAPAASSG